MASRDSISFSIIVKIGATCSGIMAEMGASLMVFSSTVQEMMSMLLTLKSEFYH
jgi:hypothetical protein